MGDASQINQVLLNLCVNARDAMPNGGPLVLKTLTVDAKDLEAHGEFASAKFAVIEVMDGGVGIDEKTQQHIFDPFFTTKPVGQGTGLGLAVVYGIVKSHGGFIHVESQPGHGATFTLYFPITSPGG
jgi:signal transduction histidine kinase